MYNFFKALCYQALKSLLVFRRENRDDNKLEGLSSDALWAAGLRSEAAPRCAPASRPAARSLLPGLCRADELAQAPNPEATSHCTELLWQPC